MRYKLADQPTADRVRKELGLLWDLLQAVDERVPKDLPPLERHEEIGRVIEADPRLQEISIRLERLARSHDGAVLWDLARHRKEEVEASLTHQGEADR